MSQFHGIAGECKECQVFGLLGKSGYCTQCQILSDLGVFDLKAEVRRLKDENANLESRLLRLVRWAESKFNYNNNLLIGQKHNCAVELAIAKGNEFFADMQAKIPKLSPVTTQEVWVLFDAYGTIPRYWVGSYGDHITIWATDVNKAIWFIRQSDAQNTADVVNGLFHPRLQVVAQLRTVQINKSNQG